MVQWWIEDPKKNTMSSKITLHVDMINLSNNDPYGNFNKKKKVGYQYTLLKEEL